MILVKTKSNKLAKTVFAVLWFSKQVCSVPTNTPISLDNFIEKFSSIKSVQTVEGIFPLIENSYTKILEEKGLLNLPPIFKEVTLDDKQYEEYFNFLKQLIHEINQQKITFDQEKVDSLNINQSLEGTTKLNLNGKDNKFYALFDQLLRKKIDYTRGWGWLSEYTSAYDIEGNYSLSRNSRDSGNTRTDNHELIINVETPQKIYAVNKILGMKITLTFMRTFNKFKDEVNTPVNEDFKLFDAVLTIPQLLKDTDMHKKIMNDFPELYSQRDLLKTCLSLKFDY